MHQTQFFEKIPYGGFSQIRSHKVVVKHPVINRLSDPSEQVSTSPSPAEQSDTATTLETSNSLSKAQTSNSTAPVKLVQSSLEQLQANSFSDPC